MRYGIGFVPEDRKNQGLMMHMSVIENSTIKALDRLQSLGFIRRKKERREADTVQRRMRLKTGSPQDPVGILSGGNQQKVLLARWLMVHPDILFLDDPARGIDVGAKQDIYDVIDELRGSGKGIILVSSELPELLRCSDRILVLREGRTAGILERGEATQERIMSLATA
jgi:ABC-type sugar transport system ATPase subunit